MLSFLKSSVIHPSASLVLALPSQYSAVDISAAFATWQQYQFEEIPLRMKQSPKTMIQSLNKCYASPEPPQRMGVLELWKVNCLHILIKLY